MRTTGKAETKRLFAQSELEEDLCEQQHKSRAAPCDGESGLSPSRLGAFARRP